MMEHGWVLTSSQLTVLSPLSSSLQLPRLLVGSSAAILVPVCSRRGSQLQAILDSGLEASTFLPADTVQP